MSVYTETIKVPFDKIETKKFIYVSKSIIESGNGFWSKFTSQNETNTTIEFKVYQMLMFQGTIEIQCNTYDNSVDISFISVNPQSWVNRTGKNKIHLFLPFIKKHINSL